MDKTEARLRHRRSESINDGGLVRNNRARCVLMTAGGKVLIENNLFERPSMMGILVEGDNQFWYESGAVEDLTIRSNKFIGLSAFAPLLRLAPMQPGEKRSLPPYHHHIRILDNTIEAASPLVLDATRVGGLEFSGNTVVLPAHPANPATPAFKLTDCADLVFRGNKFSQPAVLRTTPPDTPVRLEHNENLQQP